MSSVGSVVIAGSSGYLGRYVSAAFDNGGWSVTRLDREPVPEASTSPASLAPDSVQNDLTLVQSIADLLVSRKPDCWVHLAGAASVARSFEFPALDFEMSLLPLLNVLEAIRLSGSKCRVLLASSAAIYGEPSLLPVPESCAGKPISPYGFHKLQQELLIEEYNRFHGIAACNARIFSTYGPGLKQLAVWDIAKRALGGDFSIWGSGMETRDYLFASDVARAILCLCENAPFRGEAINVGSGHEISIVELAKCIYGEIEANRMPQLKPSPVSGNPVRWRADVSLLNSMGFSPTVTLDAGIKETVEWIGKHV